MTAWTQSRAQLAAKSKSLPPGDPELEALRRESRGHYVYEHVEKLIDGWPPLSNDQLDRVAGLLMSARTRDDGSA